MAGVWVLGGTLVLGVLAGIVLTTRDGRIRRGMNQPQGTAPPESVADALVPGTVTLVQLSTTFCAPCRQARAVLARVAETTDGLAHVEIDVAERPEVAEALRVLRTPTTIVYDAGGAELLRIGGVPKTAALRDALAPHARPTE
ncbi:thioredoxin family protein [Saccharomonospora piscinae]|uniref:TlpA family protein disulfide reductase n=1 Tax=Saccharomonospora piscinae TaxID=687388 RepID=UPI0011073DC5|nr:thioredoxin family protein [Saccharomonospora piscinae]TLW93184.1 thioredoxin family protein [Saccharomonospora piscinae]